MRLLVSPKCREPMAVGIVHWRIVLPAGIEGRLHGDELRALLAHELAHLVRGDTFWLLVGRLLCSCFAFQPLNFIARRRWRAAAELQCDLWAAELLADPFALARCLARVVEWQLQRSTLSAALAASGPRCSPLSERIERLLSSEPARAARQRIKFTRTALALGSALATAAMAYSGPAAIVPTLDQPNVGKTAGASSATCTALATMRGEPAGEQAGRSDRAEARQGRPSATDRALEAFQQLERELTSLQAELELLHQAMAESETGPPAQRARQRLMIKAKRIRLRTDLIRGLITGLAQTATGHSPRPAEMNIFDR